MAGVVDSGPLTISFVTVTKLDIIPYLFQICIVVSSKLDEEGHKLMIQLPDMFRNIKQHVLKYTTLYEDNGYLDENFKTTH